MTSQNTSQNTQSAYSHGLEKIYQFEVVNSGTVRPLASNTLPYTQEKSTKKPSDIRAESQSEEQLAIEFGSSFSKKMASLRLDEPVESLSLSPFALKALVPLRLKTIYDLSISLKDLKGVGLGHIDEIRAKVYAFIGSNPFEKKSHVDFEAFLRILFFAIDSKDRYLFLERYQLASFFPLKPNEQHEIEKWGMEMKTKSHERTLETLRKNHLHYIKNKFMEITEVFFKPWLANRSNISCISELNERLFMLSESRVESRFLTIIELIKEILATQNLFDILLVKVPGGIYAKDSHAAHNSTHVIERAISYFYTPFIRFELQKLCHILSQDFAKSWEGFPEGFIEKVLRCASCFAISRSRDGTIWIQQTDPHDS